MFIKKNKKQVSDNQNCYYRLSDCCLIKIIFQIYILNFKKRAYRLMQKKKNS